MLDHTFVILAYKESEFLETCIQSVMNQSVKSHIVIATSTPNDYISQLADKYDIQVVVNEVGNGIGGDFDFALKAAKTTYVTIAHQDDTYDEDYLKAISSRFNDKNIILFTNYGEIRGEEVVFNNTLLKVKKLMNFILQFRLFQKSKFIRRRVLSLGNSICCPAVTFNKRKVSTPLFVSDYRLNVDWQAWEKLSRLKGDFVYLPQPLMKHRVHKGSTTSEVIGETGRSEEDYRVYLEFWPTFIAKFLLKFYSKAEKSNEL